MSLKCAGVGRDAEHEKSLCFYFNRKPTNSEMSFLHDVMKSAAVCCPADPASPPKLRIVRSEPDEAAACDAGERG